MTLSKNEIREILRKSVGLTLSKQDKKSQNIALLVLLSFVVPVYIAIPLILPYSISTMVKTIIPCILIAASAIIIYFILANKIPSSKRINRELAALEGALEKESRRVITESFGRTIYQRLNPVNISVDFFQSSLCNELLDTQEAKFDSTLKFHVYIKLYQWHYIAEYFSGALDAIRSALEIDPERLIAWIWLAELYEYTDMGEKAIIAYKTIKDLPTVTANTRIYVDLHVHRVKENGARKAPPITGLRYLA